MEKEKLERCGMCGDYLQDPRLYTKEEQDNAKLTYCYDCEIKENENQQRTITRDMAIDAGDMNLEGQKW